MITTGITRGDNGEEAEGLPGKRPAVEGQRGGRAGKGRRGEILPGVSLKLTIVASVHVWLEKKLVNHWSENPGVGKSR